MLNTIQIYLVLSIPVFLIFGAGVYIGQILLSLGLIGAGIAILKRNAFIGFLAFLKTPLVLSSLVFLLYTLSSTAWSIAPERSIQTARNDLLLVMLFLAGTYSSRNMLVEQSKPIAIYGILLAVTFIAVEMTFSYPITSLVRRVFSLSSVFHQPMDKGMAYLSLLLPAAFVALTGYKKWLLLLVLAVYMAQPMLAAILAFVLSVAVYYLAIRFPKATANALLLILVCALFLLPMFFHVISQMEFYGEMVAMLPPSWQARMSMWVKAYEIIAQRPYLGFGFDTSRIVETYLDSPVVFENHPHNIILQIWVELGLVGILCLLAVVVSAFRKLERLNSNHAALLLAIISAYMVFALISFSAWKEWWISSLLIAVQYALLISRNHSTSEPL